MGLQWYLPMLVLTAAYWVLLDRVGRPMKKASRWGIVAFEFAATPERARRMMKAWGDAGSKAARCSLLLDLPFILLYVSTVALGCLLVGGPAAAAFAWAQVGAGLLDLGENLALWQVLNRKGAAPWPGVAAVCAGVKFLLLLAGILYIVVMWIG